MIKSVESWYKEPKFIDYWVEKLNETYASMSEEERNASCLIVSAHSLPEKILQFGDPYPEQLKETADLIASKTGITEYAIWMAKCREYSRSLARARCTRFNS